MFSVGFFSLRALFNSVPSIPGILLFHGTKSLKQNPALTLTPDCREKLGRSKLELPLLLDQVKVRALPGRRPKVPLLALCELPGALDSLWAAIPSGLIPIFRPPVLLDVTSSLQRKLRGKQSGILGDFLGAHGFHLSVLGLLEH